MPVLFQGAYRRSANPTVSVPAPVDGHDDPYWYDHLAMQMQSYRGLFANIQLPPVHMTIGGPAATSDGYGLWWEYHLGTHKSPTRFGHIDILRRMCAIAYRNGLYPLADWVPHQRYGGSNGTYRYPAAGGTTSGRFEKQPGCFRGFSAADFAAGRVQQDPVPDPGDDYAFGDELAPVNSVPKGYVQSELIKAGRWLYETLDLKGCRNDDTKGQAVAAVNAWSAAAPMAQFPAIGEYAEGNKDTLAWWLSQVRDNNYAYDFEVKYHLRDMCNNGSRWDMSQLETTGLATKGSYWAARAVTFVENADTDTNGFGAVVYNKLLAYAFILTSEGWPSIYYRDYAPETWCYGLKPQLDNLIWIHEQLANGVTWFRHAEYQFVVYERQGAPGLLVGLNNDIWGGWKTVTVQTSFGPNTQLHDYSGHAGDVWTDWQGSVTIGIPPNDNGAGFVCYSRAGTDSALSSPVGGPTTQLFEGAHDLITGPAIQSGAAAGRIWCDSNTNINITLSAARPVRLLITDASRHKVVDGTTSGKTVMRGWHDIVARADQPTPYRAYITYTSTPDLQRNECEY